MAPCCFCQKESPSSSLSLFIQLKHRHAFCLKCNLPLEYNMCFYVTKDPFVCCQTYDDRYIVKGKGGLSERTQTQRCPFSNYRTSHNGQLFEKSCHVIMGFCAVYSILTNWNTKGGNLSKKGFEFMLSSLAEYFCKI